MIQLIVFVPETHSEIVKEAMFNAGGGKLGNYDRCCFEHAGRGQFRPLRGSHAFVGEIGSVEIVSEIKIEMCCEENLFHQIVTAMKAAHPYETPAYYGLKALI